MSLYNRLLTKLFVVYALSLHALHIVTGLEDSDSLPSYSFQVNCNQTVGQDNFAAELTLDAEPLYMSNDSRTCDVTVQPQHLGGVLFYFTEFHVGTNCENNNVTIYHKSGGPIKGLPDALCGRNMSLVKKNQVFSSGGSQIRVRYRWSTNGDHFHAHFKIKFVAFQPGLCMTDYNLHQCSGNYCVSENIVCMDGLYACGFADAGSCAIISKVKDVINSVFGSVGNLVLIIMSIVVLICVKKCWFDNWMRRYGSVRNFPCLRGIFGSDMPSLPNERPSRSALHSSDDSEMSTEGLLHLDSEQAIFSRTTSQNGMPAPSSVNIAPPCVEAVPQIGFPAAPPTYESLDNFRCNPTEKDDISWESQDPSRDLMN